ncbi:MAG: 50S ribosomal protein L22 [Bdellovibrionales bacterium CG10_big_fil_rev_8_21_14_0_10_45_34]|nr:MAG: 50S ribosomal protein L22 [Bdellovibrionales bacterium CG10_big_fil_rev_8_21_14_0_10_45_34]
MEVKAKLRFARVGAQKARLVADLVRNKNVNDALKILATTHKKSAVMVKKLIESAVANAVQGQTVDPDSLFVKSISVDAGPVMKRYVPKAQGRASEVRKKTSHINLILDER